MGVRVAVMGKVSRGAPSYNGPLKGFRGAAVAALLVGIAGCSPTDTKRMQALLDQISHGPEDQLGTFIYGYSDASPGAQQVLMGMIRPLRAPSADKHMTYGKR